MRSWQGHNAGDWRSDQEIGAFGFWDFKVPKALTPIIYSLPLDRSRQYLRQIFNCVLDYLVSSKFRDSNQIGIAIQATAKSKANTAN